MPSFRCRARRKHCRPLLRVLHDILSETLCGSRPVEGQRRPPHRVARVVHQVVEAGCPVADVRMNHAVTVLMDGCGDDIPVVPDLSERALPRQAEELPVLVPLQRDLAPPSGLGAEIAISATALYGAVLVIERPGTVLRHRDCTEIGRHHLGHEGLDVIGLVACSCRLRNGCQRLVHRRIVEEQGRIAPERNRAVLMGRPEDLEGGYPLEILYDLWSDDVLEVGLFVRGGNAGLHRGAVIKEVPALVVSGVAFLRGKTVVACPGLNPIGRFAESDVVPGIGQRQVCARRNGVGIVEVDAFYPAHAPNVKLFRPVCVPPCHDVGIRTIDIAETGELRHGLEHAERSHLTDAGLPLVFGAVPLPHQSGTGGQVGTGLCWLGSNQLVSDAIDCHKIIGRDNNGGPVSYIPHPARSPRSDFGSHITLDKTQRFCHATRKRAARSSH